MGTVIVSLCLSVNTQGGIYLGQGYLPWPGVPTLAGGYLPWPRGYLPWPGCTYLGQGVPPTYLSRGGGEASYLGLGVPTLGSTCLRRTFLLYMSLFYHYSHNSLGH